MRSSQYHVDSDPHDAPIAPDIVPADWADCVPQPANDAASREKLFAEIRLAAERAAPKVDNTFRASDVRPVLKGRTSSRVWVRRALTVFALALLSAFATAAWKHHGDSARQALADWTPSVASSSSAMALADEPAAEQKVATASSIGAAPALTLPPEAQQQFESMARDLASMSQQIEQLKSTIETLKANQQAAVAPVAPVAAVPSRAPVQPRPKATVLPPRAAAVPAGSAYPSTTQAAAVPPPAPAAAAPSYSTATTQPNGEPIMRPPMPLPLSDRY